MVLKSEEILISIRNLTKFYGKKKVLDKISFNILSGRITGFLGPNGAGKSTTIKCLLGLINKDKTSDALIQHGEEINNFQDLKFRVKIGALLEYHSFYSDLTPVENLEILFQFDNMDIDYKKIESLLSLVNLKDSKDIKVKTFSLGMKQKLALASAFLNDPELLILDEPFNGLDPNAMDNLNKILRNYVDYGGTVFISSHILGEIEDICDNIIILNKGKIVSQGNLKEITSEKKLKKIYLELTKNENN